VVEAGGGRQLDLCSDSDEGEGEGEVNPWTKRRRLQEPRPDPFSGGGLEMDV